MRDVCLPMQADRSQEPDTRRGAATASYTWTFPGCPVRIHIELDVVERLAQQVAENSAPGRAARPTRGLLLGKGAFSDIEIHDAQFMCAGESWEAALERLGKSDDVTRAVGYFRIHDDQNLKLNEDDVSAATAFFNDPNSTFLLIRPATNEPPAAGFFFWDNGRIDGDFGFMEFPLDSTRLAREVPTRSAAPAAMAAPANGAPKSLASEPPQPVEQPPTTPEVAARQSQLSTGWLVAAVILTSVLGFEAGWFVARRLGWTEGAAAPINTGSEGQRRGNVVPTRSAAPAATAASADTAPKSLASGLPQPVEQPPTRPQVAKRQAASSAPRLVAVVSPICVVGFGGGLLVARSLGRTGGAVAPIRHPSRGTT